MTLDEALVQIERLKTVPMKYRRMEFNAQLQDANKQLSTELMAAKRRMHTLTKQRDAAKGRVDELRTYVQKYQRELVELRRTIRKGSHE